MNHKRRIKGQRKEEEGEGHQFFLDQFLLGYHFSGVHLAGGRMSGQRDGTE